MRGIFWLAECTILFSRRTLLRTVSFSASGLSRGIDLYFNLSLVKAKAVPLHGMEALGEEEM
jgi:hypothetical protein